jgi:hypothetical protein
MSSKATPKVAVVVAVVYLALRALSHEGAIAAESSDRGSCSQLRSRSQALNDASCASPSREPRLATSTIRKSVQHLHR